MSGSKRPSTSVDRQDHPGAQVCPKCGARWPTRNPLPGVNRCLNCGALTRYEPEA